mmetsp:Transcript_15/g.29  ORF Transcript_15/g.29 Transcript_15/m.29 type:complete len:329 (-) Transcript_15:22-1008(-)
MGSLPENVSSATGFTTEQRFLFDLNGFLVLRNILSKGEIIELNSAIDEHLDRARPRESSALKNAVPGTALSARGARIDLGGMLGWESPAFRKLLAHLAVAPFIVEVLGEGYRLDHQPLVLIQDPDSEGFELHGGPLCAPDGAASNPSFNPALQYRCDHGKPWTTLLAMSVCLNDTESGDGGFCILRGSHKLNFAVPEDIARGDAPAFRDHIYQPSTRAGDVILFSEATVHGALPWRPNSGAQRRLALYRFAPSTFAYGRAYLENWGANVLDLCTPAQAAVLLPPYNVRLDRPLSTARGDHPYGTVPPVQSRSDAKRAHDKATFGTTYF